MLLPGIAIACVQCPTKQAPGEPPRRPPARLLPPSSSRSWLPLCLEGKSHPGSASTYESLKNLRKNHGFHPKTLAFFGSQAFVFHGFGKKIATLPEVN